MQLDTVTFAATAPGAAGAAMTPVVGDSNTIRNARAGSEIYGLAAWTSAQAVGFTQVLWPTGHDLVRNVRYRNAALVQDNKIPGGMPWLFRPQDPVTVVEAGSAVAGDVELVSMLLYYEDLPGVDAHLINTNTLRKRGVASLTVEDSIVCTDSTYGGPRALNAAADLFKPNTEYAILGASCGVTTNAHLLSIRGVDIGNLRISIPLTNNTNLQSRNWFVDLSETFDIPVIPVINSANRAGIFIEGMRNENAVTVPFSLHLVELK